jgi:hypothetical protein
MLQRSATLALAVMAILGLAASTTGAMAKPIIKPFPKPIVKPIIKPIFVPHWPRHPQWHRPYVRIVTPVVVERVTTTAPSRPAYTLPRRACLMKEYLPTGAVLFRHVCTNEWAQNPPVEEQAPMPTRPQAEMQGGR